MTTETTYIRKARVRSEETEARIARLTRGVAARATHGNQAAEEAKMWGNGIDIVEPPYNLNWLSSLPEDSDELGQCIDAMVTGIAGFGSRIVPDFIVGEDGEPDPAIADAIKQEEADLQNFLDTCGSDDDYDSMRQKCITDLVTVGMAYFELVRDKNGKPQSIEHVVASQIRHCLQDEEFVLVNTIVRRKKADGSYALEEMPEFKRFRRYCQMSDVNCYGWTQSTLRRTYFKSLGDPRNYDNQTGEMLGEMKDGVYKEDSQKVAEAKKAHRLANELVYFTEYNVRGNSYGKPKFIGNLYSIAGARLAEKINFNTFKSNNVPSMVVLVSAGQLTEKSISRLETFVNSHIEGDENMSKFLLLEGEGLYENDEAGPAVKIDVKPLTAVQRSDGMFTMYHEDARAAIRGAFRLPPVLVGRSTEWSGAVITGARALADETIFSPIRTKWDRFFNRKILSLFGVRYHRVESNTPNTTDNTELVNLLGAAEKTGAATPEIGRTVLEQVMGKKLPKFPKDFNSKVPFSQTMAEAVKNQADPTETGQQVAPKLG